MLLSSRKMNIGFGKSGQSGGITFWAFLALWVLAAGLIFGVLYFTGLVPAYVKDFTSNAVAALDGSSSNQLPPFSKSSVSIIIPKVGLVSPVVFPTSTDLAILNRSLLSGVAHYPKSVLPGESGNVFIFGHSSSRLFVRNQAWTAFTHIHQLQTGDDVFIKSGKVEYRYRVTSVRISVDPKIVSIYLNSDKPQLTLSTCWPAGNIKNRTIVEAEFAGKFLVD